MSVLTPAQIQFVQVIASSSSCDAVDGVCPLHVRRLTSQQSGFNYRRSIIGISVESES